MLMVARAAKVFEPDELHVTAHDGDVSETGVFTERTTPVVAWVPPGDLEQPLGAVRFQTTCVSAGLTGPSFSTVAPTVTSNGWPTTA